MSLGKKKPRSNIICTLTITDNYKTKPRSRLSSISGIHSSSRVWGLESRLLTSDKPSLPFIFAKDDGLQAVYNNLHVNLALVAPEVTFRYDGANMSTQRDDCCEECSIPQWNCPRAGLFKQSIVNMDQIGFAGPCVIRNWLRSSKAPTYRIGAQGFIMLLLRKSDRSRRRFTSWKVWNSYVVNRYSRFRSR